MDKQEQLNALESQQLNAQARMGAILAHVIDYVAGLSGFKSKYPEAAAAYAAAKEESASVVEAATEVRQEWALRIGEPVSAGDVIVHEGVRYRVLQDHALQADWVPGQVPALYAPEGQEGQEPEEWPEWVQPTGAHDAYAKGAKVTFAGKHYVSKIDANVYSPAQYPQGWEEQE